MKSTLSLSFVAVLLAATAASAQDSLGSIRELYASAAYEEALSALGRLRAEAPAATLDIDRYRALCLIALGRGADADRVIESIIAVDPLFVPSPAEASPRVRAAFSTVRQRVLPGVARSMYQTAKAAYDRKAFADAVKALEDTVMVIDAIEGRPRVELSDLRTLATGFLDLSRAALTPPASAPLPSSSFKASAAMPVKPAASPAVAAPAPTPEPAPAPTPPPADAPAADTRLVAIKQELPPMPYSIGVGEYRGTVEVQIDEHGNVTSARMLEPVHVAYDPILLRATRDWKYEAPRMNGKPVASLKRVEILLRP